MSSERDQEIIANLLATAVRVTKPQPFHLVPLRDIARTPPAPPLFIWAGRVPVGVVTLLAAHGGTGKSTIMLMLAVATALGVPLFGVSTFRRRVAYYSGEDGAEVLRHRLLMVCKHFSVDPSDLDGHLHILDATEHDPRLYVEAAGVRGGDITPTFTALQEFMREQAIGLLVVDNASDVFDASEIDRGRVRAFMRALTLLARENAAGVVVLAHVDKGTSRGERAGTEGYSGSTAWHNSSRSRLFMQRDRDGALTLEHQKCNLGPLQPTLRLAWPHGGVPVLDGPTEPMVQHIADHSATKSLLRLIHEFDQRGEWVASGTTSPQNAARLLAREATYPRIKPNEVFDLLRRAERAGYLTKESRRNEARKVREVWAVTAQGMALAGLAPTAPTAPTSRDGADGADAGGGAPTAPTSGARGAGGWRAHPLSGNAGSGDAH